MRVTSAKLRFASLGVACMMSGSGTAHAQVGASLSVRSEERFRGRPVSSGNPVVAIDLSYGAGDGFYAGAAHAVVIRDGLVPRPLSFEVYAGYAQAITDILP